MLSPISPALPEHDQIKNLPKLRAYIGKGNNSNLVKSLIKRRFWWEITENIDSAHFVWTQIKVPAIH
jgi:hypothetical protein